MILKPLIRRAACFTVSVLAALALTSSNLRAQDSSDGGDKDHDDKTPKNYLTFTMGYVGTAVSRKEDKNFPKETTVVFADRFSGTIEVRPERSEDGITWYPRGDNLSIEGSISETFTSRSGLTGEGGVHATETSVAAYTGYPVCEANLVNAFVKIRPEEKLYDLQFTLMPDMASTMESVLENKEYDIVGAPSLGGEREKKSTPPQDVPLDMGPNQMSLGISNYNLVVEVKGAPLSDDASKLTGTKRILVPRPAGWNGSWDIAMEVTWTIDVSLPPVELVITAPGYAQWRPKASIGKPNEPGNDLIAKATLKSKVGKVKYLPEVKHIRFQLLDTSREPGVCMNWPLGAKDDDYDLRLAVVAGGTLSKKDQVLEVKQPKRNDEGQPYAEVRIDSFDFGGRASLRAVCLLEDGREIEGVFKGEGGGQDMVRLPKMKSPGWIADSWRKQHNAQKLADDADDEEVKGQKDNGDGYTLYEEYRGWVVNKKHVEGDPAKKDFFVLNLIGGDAQRGIDVFEKISELRVHSKLRRNEMAETTRLMNGNRRESPHRVDQHGVWVKQFVDDPAGTKNGRTGKDKLGDAGAATPLTEKGVAGRPGITKGVGILTRTNPQSVFNQPFNLPVQNTTFAFDRAIAHELLHSVGVEHHGPDDTTGYSFSFVPPNIPGNTVGRAHYRMGGDTVVNLLDEAGHDLAAQVYLTYVEAKQLMISGGMAEMIEKLYGTSFKDKPPGSAALKAFADEYVDQLARAAFGKQGMVGKEHGVHSGNQDCVMRYYFAKFYDAKEASAKTVYWVAPGTEPIGLGICRSGDGTGINAPSHRPQSRYGSATSGNGNCFEQICPNDAIPPRKVN